MIGSRITVRIIVHVRVTRSQSVRVSIEEGYVCVCESHCLVFLFLLLLLSEAVQRQRHMTPRDMSTIITFLSFLWPSRFLLRVLKTTSTVYLRIGEACGKHMQL
jgi:hypothetical protein